MGDQGIRVLRGHVFVVLTVLMAAVNTAAGLDVYQITFMEGKYWCDGVCEPEPYGLWLSVSGSGMSEVVVTLPDGNSVGLQEGQAPGGAWGFEIEDCNSLEELRDSFGSGDYVFTFNGGADSVTLCRDPNIPAGFANITYPSDGSDDVPLTSTITWESCIGYGDGIMVGVWDETSDAGQVTGLIDIRETSWTPDRLEAGHLHELEVAVFDGTTMQPYNCTTDENDSFEYYDLFEHCNTIQFTTVGSAAPYYQTQIVPFVYPSSEFVFIKNDDDVNSWAGEDYGVTVNVAINDNRDSTGMGVPSGGFRGSQGVAVLHDITDESGNGAVCALSSAFAASEGGPGGSGMPTNLSDCRLEVDIDFNVPGQADINTLYNTLGFWLAEADGDSFETPGLLNLTKGWQTYSYDLDNLADWPEWPEVGTFGDSPVTLLALSFEDPSNAEIIDRVVYFIDDFRITGEAAFYEDFEARCIGPIEGDINGDCKVDFIDLAILADDWLECRLNPPEACGQ